MCTMTAGDGLCCGFDCPGGAGGYDDYEQRTDIGFCMDSCGAYGYRWKVILRGGGSILVCYPCAEKRLKNREDT